MSPLVTQILDIWWSCMFDSISLAKYKLTFSYCLILHLVEL